MSTSNDFIEYVLELLEPIGKIKVSRMFGSALLTVGNTQLGIIMDDQLYFKVTNPVSQKKYKRQDSKQFSYTRKDKKEPVIIKNWWSVPTDALDDSNQLIELAREVLEDSTDRQL